MATVADISQPRFSYKHLVPKTHYESSCEVNMITYPQQAFLVTLDGRTVRFNSGRDGLFHCKAENLSLHEPLIPLAWEIL